MPTLYRAASKDVADALQTPPDTRRIPRHVPYVVDNLWAWARPASLVDRRHTAFAFGDPDEAFEAAHSRDPVVYRVVFEGAHTVCQLVGEGKLFSNSDAKYHPDTRALKAELVPMLARAQGLSAPDWASLPVTEKNGAALFAPCLTADEVQTVLNDAGVPDDDQDTLRDRVTYWDDLVVVEDDAPLPDPNGEITIAAPDGYRLVATDA